jgi:probable addiction module antidote protein
VAGRSKKTAKPLNRRSSGATATSYDDWARNTLAADSELTVEYLRDVLEQSDTPAELLLGLRRIAEAQGMSRVAEEAGLSRESLYRSLSAAGNPRLSTLVAVLRVAGLRLSVRPAA